MRALVDAADGHFVRDMNPRGPQEIFVGRGLLKEPAAKILAEQADAVPTFEKITDGEWRYVGNFKGVTYVTRSDAISEANRASGRDDVAGILHLAPVARR